MSPAFAAFGLVCLLGSSARGDLGDGLVEYWAFDGDYSAGLSEDHLGTLVTSGSGAAMSGFVAGKFGQGINLGSADSSNQAYVEIGGDENDFDFVGGNMSVSTWYTTGSLYVNFQTLVGKGENASWRVARNGASGNALKLAVLISGDGKLDQQDGSWHHVVATVDALEGPRVYVDGLLVASGAGPTNLIDVPTPMQIGGNPQAAGRAWDGIIDDAAVWNRAISEEEVSAIWNEGMGADIASLIGASNAPFAITSVDYSPTDSELSLEWNSRANETYVVKYSMDMMDWSGIVGDGISGGDGETTAMSFDLSELELAGESRLFFRVEIE